MKLDLTEGMSLGTEPKQFKESVALLYRKHVQNGLKKVDLDTDLQKEFNRQRDYLEKSVDSLKRKLDKDSQAHRVDNMRIMKENVSLIQEINDLRREFNQLKHDRISQESQLTSHYDEKEREIAKQREDILRYTKQLTELQSTAQLQSTHERTRLPTATPLSKTEEIEVSNGQGEACNGGGMGCTLGETSSGSLEGATSSMDGDGHKSGTVDHEEDVELQ